MDYVKQSDKAFVEAPFDAIITDGCLYRSLLKGAEFITGKMLTQDEIKRAFTYAIPEYMEDHRNPRQDRCYIKAGGHGEIIRIGCYILGERNVKVAYRYRQDIRPGGNKVMVIGREDDLAGCNFWISKCKPTSFSGHFYQSDMGGLLLWDPGQSYTKHLLSVRGFYIEIV